MDFADSATDGCDDDYERAHRLFIAAYSMPPGVDGHPRDMTIRLLRAATVAWQRYLDGRPASNASDLDLSDSLRDWCFSHSGH